MLDDALDGASDGVPEMVRRRTPHRTIRWMVSRRFSSCWSDDGQVPDGSPRSSPTREGAPDAFCPNFIFRSFNGVYIGKDELKTFVLVLT